MNVDRTEHRRTFDAWLRTGRVPSMSDEGIELKFNPWHDQDNGQFTHPGTGRHYGSPGAKSPVRPANGARKAKPVERPSPPPSSGPLKKVAEFAGGVGQGIYDVGRETATGLYEAATTNPVTTVRNFGAGIAKTIDGAIAAEDTPAHVQVRRAANVVANASAYDIGYATGRVAGNFGLATVPGAAATKISAARRASALRPRETFHPAEVGWANENLKSDQVWKTYNDTATGARPGKAPTLIRTMPDGSKRPVKFDGVDGDTVIDRKWSVSGKPRARAQILRQAEVLAQHRLIGTWEVPTATQRDKAIKLLRKLNVTNIKVRVIKP